MELHYASASSTSSSTTPPSAHVAKKGYAAPLLALPRCWHPARAQPPPRRTCLMRKVATTQPCGLQPPASPTPEGLGEPVERLPDVKRPSLNGYNTAGGLDCARASGIKCADQRSRITVLRRSVTLSNDMPAGSIICSGVNRKTLGSLRTRPMIP